MIKFRALDCHTHVHTGDRAKSQEEGRSDARRMFGASGERPTTLDYFRSRNMMAVIFDVDAETTNGLKVSNQEIADLARNSGGNLIGFGTVDPWKGKPAIREVQRFSELGLKGLKLQPITQAFFPNDKNVYPLWETCQSLGLVVTIHMGTTAIGARTPGGRGLHLEYARPIPGIDNVAADFPRLKIIAAHPGWPWHLELLAVVRHKENVFIDLSGWAPKYFPGEVVQHFTKVMPEKFLYGSDFPLLMPDRWFEEFNSLYTLDQASRRKIMFENSCNLLGIDLTQFELEGE